MEDAVRIRVRYQGARDLLTAYTSSVTRGGCLVHTQRRVEQGTQFIFEMESDPNLPPTEVRGTVVRVTPRENDFEVAVQYHADEETRQALEVLLMRVMVDTDREVVRQHPRIPVNLVAVDEHSAGMRYLIRDMSIGGMGIALPVGRDLPDGLQKGTLVTIGVALAGGASVRLNGHVAWLTGRTPAKRASVGIRIHALNDSQRMLVLGMTHLLRPEGLSLKFEVGELFDGKVAQEPSDRRAALLDFPLIALHQTVDAIAESFGVRLEGRAVSERILNYSRALSVQVGFTGALEGSLTLRTHERFAAEIARISFGETGGQAEIRDALNEILTIIGGRVGDALEKHGYLIDVLPPTEPSETEPAQGEQRFMYTLDGGIDPIELTIVMRPPAAVPWPT